MWCMWICRNGSPWCMLAIFEITLASAAKCWMICDHVSRSLFGCYQTHLRNCYVYMSLYPCVVQGFFKIFNSLYRKILNISENVQFTIVTLSFICHFKNKTKNVVPYIAVVIFYVIITFIRQIWELFHKRGPTPRSGTINGGSLKYWRRMEIELMIREYEVNYLVIS